MKKDSMDEKRKKRKVKCEEKGKDKKQGEK